MPDADAGEVRVETVPSAAMGGEVGLFSAVPAGHGDGAGLPVVVVLHGASATVDEFEEFGFPQFVTAAVEAGAPPFVLVGPEDGPSGWVADGDVDPPAFLRDEAAGAAGAAGVRRGAARGLGLVAGWGTAPCGWRSARPTTRGPGPCSARP